MRLRVSKRRVLGIEIEDPLGLFWGSNVAAHTYGRGIRISLRRMPGQGWTQTSRASNEMPLAKRWTTTRFLANPK